MTALMLRNNEAVGVSEPRGALLAADEAGVLLEPVPLPVVHHDVVPDPVDLGGRSPGRRSGALADIAGEADPHVDDRLFAEIADSVRVRIRLIRVEDGQ